MQQHYSSSYFSKTVALLGIIFLNLSADAQTTSVPGNGAALSTWQMFRGGTQHHAQQLQKGNIAAAPTLKWQVTIPPGTGGGGEGEPAIGDVDGNGITDVVSAFKKTVNAINGTTGALLWQYTTGLQINGSPVIADVDNNGTMDVVVCSDKVYALNGSNGSVIWSYTAVPATTKGFNSSPVVAKVVLTASNPQVIVTCDNGRAYCLDGKTGTVVWSYTITNTTENFWASPAVGDVDKNGQPDVVIISPAAFNNSGGQVIALNGNVGSVIWTYTNAAFKWDIIPQSPVIADVNQDCIMDVLAPQGGNLYVLNGATGALQWSKNGAGNATPAVADIDNNCSLEIICGGPTAYKWGGTQIWSVSGSNSGWNAPAPRVGDFSPGSPGLEIIVGNAYDTVQSGTNYLVKMYSNTGTLIWGYKNVGHTTEGIAVGDIDNDGCVEVVVNPDCCNGVSSVIALDDVSGSTNCGVSPSPSNAAFTANPSTVCVGGCVTFANLSSICATSWQWNFPGGNPSSYSGQTPPQVCYSTAGTYTAQLVATFGNCSPLGYDTAYLPILVQNCNNVNVNITGANLCAGNCTTINSNITGGTSPYTYAWNPSGQTTASINVCPTSTTTYSVTVHDAAGNTAIDTAVVTINSAPAATVSSPVTICSGSPYTLTAGGGGTYSWSTGATSTSISVSPTTNTNYSVVVSNASGCKDTAVTSITVTPIVNPTVSPAVICAGDSTIITASGGSSYSWNTGSSSSSITVSPTTTTSYTVLVTAGTCTATAVATVTVTTSIVANVSPSNPSICLGSSSTLTASGGTTFSWSTGNTSASIIISPTTNATYSVIVSSGTCADSTSITVTVNQPPVPTISPAQTICIGTNASLTAGGGNSFSWSNGASFPTISVNPNTTTGYTVTVTDANGCTAMASTTVTVSQGPTALVSGNTLLCKGDATTLTASGGNSYSWNTGATSASVSSAPTSTITYTVFVTDASGCTDDTTITVNVSNPPVANITGNNTICAGGNTILTASGGGNYLWSNGATTSSITVSPATSSNYSVMVSIGSCKDSANYSVTVQPNPVATAQSNVTINIGDNATLTASGGGNYSWVPATGLSCTNCSNPVASPQQTTDYCVYVIGSAGCTDSACVTVTVDINCKPVYLPNAFSPNDDLDNDILYVYGNCIKNMKLIIYNRWGEKVYEGTDPKEGWNGIYKGRTEDTGVFAYYLEYTLLNGNTGNKKGNISLVR